MHVRLIVGVKSERFHFANHFVTTLVCSSREEQITRSSDVFESANYRALRFWPVIAFHKSLGSESLENGLMLAFAGAMRSYFSLDKRATLPIPGSSCLEGKMALEKNHTRAANQKSDLLFGYNLSREVIHDLVCYIGEV